VFHELTWQFSGDVFEFIWDRDVPEDCHPIPEFKPAPVLIQRTAIPFPAGEILTATFELGNSSPVRKRVSVLIHEWDFKDLAACSFWLEPGTPLQTYRMRMVTTMAWTETAFSVYAASRGPETWIQFDNAELRSTPGTATAGIECLGPFLPSPLEPDVEPAARAGGLSARAQSRHLPAFSAGTAATAQRPDLFVRPARHLSFLLAPDNHERAIEVSEDGDVWQTVVIVEPSEEWRRISIDLSALTGPARYVRVTGG
jgi:hypothetical protein